MNLIVIFIFNYFYYKKFLPKYNSNYLFMSCLNGALILSLTVSIASLALDHLLGLNTN